MTGFCGQDTEVKPGDEYSPRNLWVSTVSTTRGASVVTFPKPVRNSFFLFRDVPVEEVLIAPVSEGRWNVATVRL